LKIAAIGDKNALGCTGARMQLTVNGESKDIPEGLTVRGLIEHLGLTEGPVAVERNREVVPRAEHATVELRAGDVLEIVHFVGGG
jgi:sulfur carrier protein